MPHVPKIRLKYARLISRRTGRLPLKLIPVGVHLIVPEAHLSLRSKPQRCSDVFSIFAINRTHKIGIQLPGRLGRPAEEPGLPPVSIDRDHRAKAQARAAVPGLCSHPPGSRWCAKLLPAVHPESSIPVDFTRLLIFLLPAFLLLIGCLKVGRILFGNGNEGIIYSASRVFRRGPS